MFFGRLPNRPLNMRSRTFKEEMLKIVDGIVPETYPCMVKKTLHMLRN
jgi:hypothetical protein